MLNNNNINLKIIENIKNYINSNDNIKNKFNHPNQKYKIDELLQPLLIILQNGCSYRNIQIYTKINWNMQKYKNKVFIFLH